MRRLWRVWLLCAAAFGATRATAHEIATGPAQAAQAPQSRDARIRAITKEYDDARNANYAAYRKRFSGDEQPSAEALAAFYTEHPLPEFAAYAARVRAVVDEDPRDVATLSAVRWAAMGDATAQDLRPWLELVVAHHLDSTELGDLCTLVARHGEFSFLERVLAGSPHLEVRGRACLALADAKKQEIEQAAQLATLAADELEGWRRYLGTERVDALRKLDLAAAQREVEALFERAIREFGAVELDAGTKRATTVAKRAEQVLFELRHLIVGKVAPEIEGQDLDGVAFKLSDYRGKVVLLDFWGNW
jgi:hypothetical protein